jgi:DNA-directed RNA polymerase specialized sigma24 family protein
MSNPLLAVVQSTLLGRPEAARRLVDQLYPVVQARVVRVLHRTGRTAARNARQEADDLVQEVFTALFDRDGRALRAWDPARGLSLDNFVGLLAERCTVSILRSGRRSPFTEDPTADADLDAHAEPTSSPEPAALSRDLLVALLDRLRQALSPIGMRVFELLFVEERPVEEVTAMMKMSPDAVYAWRSRLRKLAGSLLAELGRATPVRTIAVVTEP